jgi:hypothetical protein
MPDKSAPATGHDMMITEPEWVADKLLSVATVR